MESWNEKTTVVTFVLDESGSMDRNRQRTIEGFNDYISELKEDTTSTLLRLQTFNSNGFKVPFQFEDIHELDELTQLDYIPAAMTPLLDAVGLAISDTEKFLTDIPGEPQVIVTIMTDGLENASTTYTAGQIQQRIEEKKSQGWIFTYLGANHDAWSVGRNMGIDRKDVSRFSTANPKLAFRKSATSTLNIKGLASRLQADFMNQAKCPRCETGNISETVRGLFICSNSEECGWITRCRPLSSPSCPECEGLLFWVRRLQVVCGNRNCGYSGSLL